MKHKHFEIIVAKADNMALVRFVKCDDNNKCCEWVEQATALQVSTQFNRGREYFLCLPQHKETCLHWLNGGEVEAKLHGDFKCVLSDRTWTPDSIFMSYDCKIRIKEEPIKEERWIAYSLGFLGGEAFKTEQEAIDYYGCEYQFIKIEVKV